MRCMILCNILTHAGAEMSSSLINRIHKPNCNAIYQPNFILTLYCPYLYSYPIGIALFETRLTSPLGQ